MPFSSATNSFDLSDPFAFVSANSLADDDDTNHVTSIASAHISRSSHQTPLTDITNGTPNQLKSKQARSVFDVLMNKSSIPFSNATTRKRLKTTPKSKSKSKGEQLYIDVGQSNLGAVSCKICGMHYHRGQPTDEAAHHKQHKPYVSGVEWHNLKNEDVVVEFPDGARVLRFTSNNMSIKVREAFAMMNRDLGNSTTEDDEINLDDNQHLLLYIHKKRIEGGVIARIVQNAHVIPKNYLQTPELPSEPTAPTTAAIPTSTMGVDKMWVHHAFRRQQVATKLVDAAWKALQHAMPLHRHCVAFSQPTKAGYAFAKTYTGTDAFLAYQ